MKNCLFVMRLHWIWGVKLISLKRLSVTYPHPERRSFSSKCLVVCVQKIALYLLVTLNIAGA